MHDDCKKAVALELILPLVAWAETGLAARGSKVGERKGCTSKYANPVRHAPYDRRRAALARGRGWAEAVVVFVDLILQTLRYGWSLPRVAPPSRHW